MSSYRDVKTITFPGTPSARAAHTTSTYLQCLRARPPLLQENTHSCDLSPTHSHSPLLAQLLSPIPIPFSSPSPILQVSNSSSKSLTHPLSPSLIFNVLHPYVFSDARLSQLIFDRGTLFASDVSLRRDSFQFLVFRPSSSCHFTPRGGPSLIVQVGLQALPKPRLWLHESAASYSNISVPG